MQKPGGKPHPAVDSANRGSTHHRLGDVAELTMVDEGLIHEGHLNRANQSAVDSARWDSAADAILRRLRLVAQASSLYNAFDPGVPSGAPASTDHGYLPSKQRASLRNSTTRVKR